MIDVQEEQAEVPATIASLSVFQYQIVKRLCRWKKSNVYAAFTGEPGTPTENDANVGFNATCQLVEAGLMKDVSHQAQFMPMHVQLGRTKQEMIVVTPTDVALKMFGRVKWEKWVN